MALLDDLRAFAVPYSLLFSMLFKGTICAAPVLVVTGAVLYLELKLRWRDVICVM
jgi:hypothetical protein